MQNAEYINVLIRIKGLVQGIGFRPHVYRTALSGNISGTVGNTVDGVEIHARGSAEDMESFIDNLQHHRIPPAAVIQEMTVSEEEEILYSDFKIVKSPSQGASITRISPDLAVCRDCLEDMRKPGTRWNYPFINCTNCGPRFSIIRDIPYDRDKTTMSGFTMCDACRGEFEDISDRRFHAQPIACADCGPEYSISGKYPETTVIDKIIRYSAGCIDNGDIAAVMGMGGYHLICDGSSSNAVGSLRVRKQRESKPFALMMPDIKAIREYADMSPAEEELLESVRRPIVLLKQKPGTLPEEINGGLHTIGVMLPYMPFHYLLFKELRTRVLVMSSGNRSSEPIVISHDEAVRKFSGIADCIVSHNRRIHNRVDDSVLFTSGKEVHIIRRSRGWVPDPLLTELPVDQLAAFGGELKNTFALGRKNHIIPSQHIGDLNNSETMDFFEESYSRFKRLYSVAPRLLIHDMHPDYLSTRLAIKTASNLGLPVMAVQHHEAHIASVIVENGLKEKVIGICYDGAGYGKDGTIWGGEIFSGWLDGFQRELHLDPIKLPGGDAASRETWRTALSLLFQTFGDEMKSLPLELLEWISHNEGTNRAEQIIYMLKNDINCPRSSSMGRLFDGVSALLGICFKNRYEGEAPMLLEAAAAAGEDGCYSRCISGELIETRGIIQAVVQDILQGEHRGIVAARFMNTIVLTSCDGIDEVSRRTGIRNVAMSGGVFQNRYLLEQCSKKLIMRGYTVYSNSLIPANDGGLSVGQIGMGAVAGIKAGG